MRMTVVDAKVGTQGKRNENRADSEGLRFADYAQPKDAPPDCCAVKGCADDLMRGRRRGNIGDNHDMHGRTACGVFRNG